MISDANHQGIMLIINVKHPDGTVHNKLDLRTLLHVIIQYQQFGPQYPPYA